MGAVWNKIKLHLIIKRVVNIVHKLTGSSSSDNDPTVRNSLIGTVTLTENADNNKYKYSGYEIGFDRHGSFSFPGSGFGSNVIFFGADMTSSVHVDNKKKDILILGKGTPQGLGEHSLAAEKMYLLNFTVTGKNFCLSFRYNGANSYLFFDGTKIIKFKSNHSETVATPLCLGNISKDWSVDNMKSTWFNAYVDEFSVDYDVIAVDDILDIHNYLMKKNDIA